MSLELTVGGAVVPPIGRSFRFALLGLGVLLFAAAHADADSVYEFDGPTLAPSFQQQVFHYDQDRPCYDQCGSTALLSWTTPEGGEALDSSDGLPDENRYGAVLIVSIETDTADPSWELETGVR